MIFSAISYYRKTSGREFPECPGKGRGKTIAPSATGKAFFRPSVRIRRVRANAGRWPRPRAATGGGGFGAGNDIAAVRRSGAGDIFRYQLLAKNIRARCAVRLPPSGGFGRGIIPPDIRGASRGDFRAVRGERVRRRPRPPGPRRGVRSRRGARIPRMPWQGAGENNRAQRNRKSVFPSARPHSAGSGECAPAPCAQPAPAAAIKCLVAIRLFVGRSAGLGYAPNGQGGRGVRWIHVAPRALHRFVRRRQAPRKG